MQPFKKFTGTTLPIDRANIDTDTIIPKQYLKSVKKTGFGPNLFDDWRYLTAGEPGQDHSVRKLNTEFIMNNPMYKEPSILLTRDNFGCGSSREHAVWAIMDYGIKAVIAPSFADIFYNNSLKNGLLPIIAAAADMDSLFKKSIEISGYSLTIDLVNQNVADTDNFSFSYDIDEFSKYCLLEGLDDIGITLKLKEKILNFEKEYKKRAPWFFDQF
ncbi:MAG: 3-isopropylmalate dehydratase small subunit [Pseudomonadota bacterium]